MAMDVDATTAFLNLALPHGSACNTTLDLDDTPMEDVDDTTSTSTLATTFPRFRDLPAELRDNILDFSLLNNTELKLAKGSKDRKIVRSDVESMRDFFDDQMSRNSSFAAMMTEKPYAIHASVRNAADTNILLVDKEMREEYRRRANLHMFLEFKDHEQYAFAPFTVPAAMKAVFYIVFHILLFCHTCPLATHLSEKTCHAAGELLRHIEVIKDVLSQMTTLKEVYIFAHICHDSYKIGSKLRAPCEQIVERMMPKLQDVDSVSRVLLYRHDHCSKTNLKGPKEVLYEWRDGKVTFVEPPPGQEENKDENKVGNEDEEEGDDGNSTDESFDDAVEQVEAT